MYILERVTAVSVHFAVWWNNGDGFSLRSFDPWTLGLRWSLRTALGLGSRRALRATLGCGQSHGEKDEQNNLLEWNGKKSWMWITELILFRRQLTNFISTRISVLFAGGDRRVWWHRLVFLGLFIPVDLTGRLYAILTKRVGITTTDRVIFSPWRPNTPRDSVPYTGASESNFKNGFTYIQLMHYTHKAHFGVLRIKATSISSYSWFSESYSSLLFLHTPVNYMRWDESHSGNLLSLLTALLLDFRVSFCSG